MDRKILKAGTMEGGVSVQALFFLRVLLADKAV